MTIQTYKVQDYRKRSASLAMDRCRREFFAKVYNRGTRHHVHSVYVCVYMCMKQRCIERKRSIDLTFSGRTRSSLRGPGAHIHEHREREKMLEGKEPDGKRGDSFLSLFLIGESSSRGHTPSAHCKIGACGTRFSQITRPLTSPFQEVFPIFFLLYILHAIYSSLLYPPLDCPLSDMLRSLLFALYGSRKRPAVFPLNTRLCTHRPNLCVCVCVVCVFGSRLHTYLTLTPWTTIPLRK